MYPKRSNIRFLHTVDIYEKITTENDTGQLFSTWTVVEQDKPCFYTPSGAATSIRVSPTAEEAEYYTILLPHDSDINYTSRLYNVKDRLTGEVIDAGPLQVWQINKHVSTFSGRVQFLSIKSKTVIE